MARQRQMTVYSHMHIMINILIRIYYIIFCIIFHDISFRHSFSWWPFAPLNITINIIFIGWKKWGGGISTHGENPNKWPYPISIFTSSVYNLTINYYIIVFHIRFHLFTDTHDSHYLFLELYYRHCCEIVRDDNIAEFYIYAIILDYYRIYDFKKLV